MLSVYALYASDEKVIRYIGITSDPNVRYSQHIHYGDTEISKDSWISQALARGADIKMIIIDTAVTRLEALEKEKYYIRTCLDKNMELVNSVHNTNTVSKAGRKHTNEDILLALLMYARTGDFPPEYSYGTKQRLLKHPKLKAIRKLVKLERQGQKIDYSEYLKNAKERGGK